MPRVTLVTRKTYGGAYIAMNSRVPRRDEGFRVADAPRSPSWARSPRSGSCTAASWPRCPDDSCAQVEAELAAEHEQLAGGLARAVEIGVIDEIISPADTATAIRVEAIAAAPQPRGQHRNIPL